MKDCIYNTDPDWIATLQKLGLKEDINFWRKDKRMTSLRKGAFFYFKIRGEQSIIGRGIFRSLRFMTVNEAWDEFKERNGVETLTQLHQRINSLYDVGEQFNGLIGCMVLDDLNWLDYHNRIMLTEEIFPHHILASKFHERGSLPDLEKLFSSFVEKNFIPAIVREVPKEYIPSGTTGQFEQKIINDFTEFEIPTPSFSSDYPEPTDPSVRQLTHSYRILRDTTLSMQIKALYKYRCQLCGQVLEASSGERYAEAHHLKPLGTPHNGPDIANNIICVCPNCHAKLDYGIIRIEIPKLNLDIRHKIDAEFINYHNNNIFEKVL